ncbi:MAG: hypothetical protein EA408_11790 [Marinilabiliales bacterium]|nr:MAG: hypothetical protein EA408_11790 [Marinilabiliales bacterium]
MEEPIWHLKLEKVKSNKNRHLQYMAGHKYVSSTGRYQLGNLDKLQSRLEKLNPLADKMF